ncbi:MAG TPA: hypothetical protein VGL94_01180 [Ktedonobacteraceae bacterium]|jgi:hypothetical protein
MSDTFNELYNSLIKDIFLERARQQLEQGTNGLACANTYADQGKIDFALAYLLLSEAPEDVKREILAHAYEQCAILCEEKAEEFARQYHRSFPLIKLEAQKDRLSAQQVRQKKPVLRRGKTLNIN